MDDDSIQRVTSTMREINRAWLDGRIDDLGRRVHRDIVMLLPGFAGRIRGRVDFLLGFKEFCEGATIHQFEEFDQQIDRIGHTAVIAFRYEMLYERSGQRYHAKGRDLWVFEEKDGDWLTVWRTMLDMEEVAA
jgi:hypothetical protein